MSIEARLQGITHNSQIDEQKYKYMNNNILNELHHDTTRGKVVTTRVEVLQQDTKSVYNDLAIQSHAFITHFDINTYTPKKETDLLFTIITASNFYSYVEPLTYKEVINV